MRKMFDYICGSCAHQFEALADEATAVACESCGHAPTDRRVSGGHLFTVIKATTNTSKRYKAGYVHKFQNRPAEKLSMQVPATSPAE